MKMSRALAALSIATFSWLVMRSSANAQRSTARGIEYSIDTALFQENNLPPGAAALREWALFSSFTARVRFAAGRGRLDVLSRRAGPRIVVDSFASTLPLGGPGDYYLFDRQGFLLVHPSSRTYSSFSISYDSYGFPGSRDGWPKAFEFHPPREDTVPTRGSMPGRHGRFSMFWHSDQVSGGPVARGRFTVDDAPYGELNVARWFAATLSLARLVDSTGKMPPRLTVTSAVPEIARPLDEVVPSVLLKQELSEVRVAPVDLRELVLPPDFVGVRWHGGDGLTPRVGVKGADSRWRALPQTVK